MSLFAKRYHDNVGANHPHTMHGNRGTTKYAQLINYYSKNAKFHGNLEPQAHLVYCPKACQSPTNKVTYALNRDEKREYQNTYRRWVRDTDGL
jgi:hypothetical protein